MSLDMAAGGVEFVAQEKASWMLGWISVSSVTSLGGMHSAASTTYHEGQLLCTSQAAVIQAAL